MDLHREYASRFNISNEELETTEAASTTTAYTSYMLNVSQRGGIENVVASVLACAWSYNYIGKSLAKWPGALDHEFYGNWVQMYSSEGDRKSTRLNSSHVAISYAVFCLKK